MTNTKKRFYLSFGATAALMVSAWVWTMLVAQHNLSYEYQQETASHITQDLKRAAAGSLISNVNFLSTQEVKPLIVTTRTTTATDSFKLVPGEVTVAVKTDLKSDVTITRNTLTAEVITPEKEEAEELKTAAPEKPVNTELDQWGIQPDYELNIPAIGVSTTVYRPTLTYWNQKQWDLLEDQMQVGLNHGAVVYPHSPAPKQNGTMIIAGHSSPPTQSAAASGHGDLFAKVPDLAIGEEILMTDKGVQVSYTVTDTYVVRPSNTKILTQDTSQESIKLITCYPVGTTALRWVTEARPTVEVSQAH